MVQDNKHTGDTIEFRLKYYQMLKEIESLKEKNKKEKKKDSYQDLLKFRRGKSKY